MLSSKNEGDEKWMAVAGAKEELGRRILRGIRTVQITIKGTRGEVEKRNCSKDIAETDCTKLLHSNKRAHVHRHMHICA